VISCKVTNTSLIRQQSASFYLEPITATEVFSHIKQLNPAKNNGPEGIPLKFLKMMGDIITPILTNLYDRIKLGIQKFLKLHKLFPSIKVVQKISVVILDPYHFSVHFPKFLKNVCMSDYIYISKKFDVLTKFQFGFKQKCSTSNAVRLLYDEFRNFHMCSLS